MSADQKHKLQTVVEMVDKMAIHPLIDIEYFIPGVVVTTKDGGNREIGGPYIEFKYDLEGSHPHIQHMPLTHGYMDKSPEDLTNLITFSVERFMEEIDSRQYGAQ